MEINGDKILVLKDKTDRLRKEIEELMEEVWKINTESPSLKVEGH